MSKPSDRYSLLVDNEKSGWISAGSEAMLSQLILSHVQ